MTIGKIPSEPFTKQLQDANLFLQASDGDRIAFTACPWSPHLWQKFKRLHKQWSALPKGSEACRRLVLLCDVGPDHYKEGTRKWFDTLSGLSGVCPICPDLDQQCGLEALHSLLTDAHAGNLAWEGHTVEAEAVDRWARESIVEPLHPVGKLRVLLDELGLEVGTGPIADPQYTMEQAGSV